MTVDEALSQAFAKSLLSFIAGGVPLTPDLLAHLAANYSEVRARVHDITRGTCRRTAATRHCNEIRAAIRGS